MWTAVGAALALRETRERVGLLQLERQKLKRQAALAAHHRQQLQRKGNETLAIEMPGVGSTKPQTGPTDLRNQPPPS